MSQITGFCWVLLAFSISGCSPKSGTAAPGQAKPNGFPSIDKVKSIILPGTTRNAVVSAFGPPYTEDHLADGTVVDMYKAPLEPDSGGWRDKFTGFQVYYQTNCVTDWKPIYSTLLISSGVATNGSLPAPNPKMKVSQLSFYVTSETPIAGGRYIIHPKLGDIGYLPAIPALTVKQLASVDRVSPTQTASNSPGESPDLKVTLLKEDAVHLEQITKENFAKRLLITADSNPLTAPRILSPISNGVFQISGISKAECEDLDQALTGMVRR